MLIDEQIQADSIDGYRENIKRKIGTEDDYFAKLMTILCLQSFFFVIYSSFVKDFSKDYEVIANFSNKVFKFVKKEEDQYLEILTEGIISALSTVEEVAKFDLSWKFFSDKTVEMDLGPNTDKIIYEVFKSIITGEGVRNYAERKNKNVSELDLIDKFLAVEDKSITTDEIESVMKVEQMLLKAVENNELLKRIANTCKKAVDLNQDKIYVHLSNKTQETLDEKCKELKIDKSKLFGGLKEINEKKFQALVIEAFFSKKDYNVTTIARMVENAAKKGKIKNLSDSIFELLSAESKAKIEQIATEIEERNKTNALLLAIEDIINIVVNFLAIILGKGVSHKDFETLAGLCNEEKGEENKFSKMIEEHNDKNKLSVPLPVF